MNEALAYPFMQSNGHPQNQYTNTNQYTNNNHPYNQQQPNLPPPSPPRRGPIEGPNGRRLIRRVTWRSSTYKLMASLWVLAVLYIVWLVRDLFYQPVPPETAPRE